MGLRNTLQGALTGEKKSGRKTALSSEQIIPARKTLCRGREKNNISVQSWNKSCTREQECNHKWNLFLGHLTFTGYYWSRRKRTWINARSSSFIFCTSSGCKSVKSSPWSKLIPYMALLRLFSQVGNNIYTGGLSREIHANLLDQEKLSSGAWNKAPEEKTLWLPPPRLPTKALLGTSHSSASSKCEGSAEHLPPESTVREEICSACPSAEITSQQACSVLKTY